MLETREEGGLNNEERCHNHQTTHLCSHRTTHTLNLSLSHTHTPFLSSGQAVEAGSEFNSVMESLPPGGVR